MSGGGGGEVEHKLSGQVVIVTGAGRGIGRGMSLVLAAAGAKVVLASRSSGPLEAVAREIRARGGEALPVVCDVGDRAQVNETVGAAIEAYGRIDVLINNAQGWGLPGDAAPSPPPTPFAEMPEAMWDNTFQTGVKGTFYFCQAVFPHMRERGGKIVNFGSPAAITGVPLMADYCAAKEAIRGLSRSLAREWGQYGITVNIVCPVVETDAIRAHRALDPERDEVLLRTLPLLRRGDAERDAGPLAVFLASSDSDYFTGHSFMLDGGRTMI